MYDIVIPLGPNDTSLIKEVVSHTKNILNHRNIYIVTMIKDLSLDNCIIIDEAIFPFSKKSISEINPSIKPEKTGWYLQQLIKLYAGFIIPNILPDYLVVDADTIFLKEIDFMSDNKYLFTISDENHKPYFVHMNKLHNSLKRNLNCSGIAHHMIFNIQYIGELFQLIETKYHIDFWKVFIKFVDRKQNNGASEYEIYFNFMVKYHPELCIIRKLNWINTSDYSEITKKNYDYISIHWYLR